MQAGTQKPILFQQAMIRAIWHHRCKHETRRTRGLESINANPGDWELIRHTTIDSHYVLLFVNYKTGEKKEIFSPYGNPGGALWVRENFWLYDPAKPGGEQVVRYTADEKPGAKAPPIFGTRSGALKVPARITPCIHMPRWASRITLCNIGLRVERLHEITEIGARNEGAIYHDGGGIGHSGFRHDENYGFVYATARESFFKLWESINGKESLNSDPWVWVIDFETHRANIDKLNFTSAKEN